MADFLCFSPGKRTRASIVTFEAPPSNDPQSSIEGPVEEALNDSNEASSFFPRALAASRFPNPAPRGTRSITDGRLNMSVGNSSSSSSSGLGQIPEDGLAMVPVVGADETERPREPYSDTKCPICEEVIYKPIVTRCGHHFCLACITMWLKEAPLHNCPLCRYCLEDTSSSSFASDDLVDTRPPFVPDHELELLAIERLGSAAYHERELDTLEERLEKKLQAYREKLDRISEGSGVAVMGLGLAGVTTATAVCGACTAAYVNTYMAAQAVGLSTLAAGSIGDGLGLLTAAHTYAGSAFWSTVYSAEIASNAAAAGMVAGVGVAAFLGGMKLAAWLDDQGRYCLLRSPHRPALGMDAAHGPSIWILNLLGKTVSARIFAAKRKKQSSRKSVTESIADFVAQESGIRADDPNPKSRLYLEAIGEPLVKMTLQPKSEVRISIPSKAERPEHMVLTAVIEGLVVDSELGSCRVRSGQRFILCEFDESASEVLRGNSKPEPDPKDEPKEKASNTEDAQSSGESDNEPPPAPPPQWRRQRWEDRRPPTRSSTVSSRRASASSEKFSFGRQSTST